MAYGDFEYEITDEKVKITRDGPTATVTMKVPWNDADLFCVEMVGGYRSFGGLLTYYTPALYDAANVVIYCNDASYVQAGDQFEDGGWRTAIVTLQFGQLDQPEDEQAGNPTQIADFSYDVSAQEMTLPRGGLGIGTSPGELENNKLKEDEHPRPIKIIAEGGYTASYKCKPKLSDEQWAPYVGKVNQEAIFGADAEQLLFVGVSTQRTRTTDGHDAWSYDVNFQRKYDHTWNQIWNAKSGQWEDFRGLDGAKQYQPDNFADLLTNIGV